MTTKERIIEQLEQMEETDLLALERQLRAAGTEPSRAAEGEEKIKRQVEALHAVAGMLSDPEDYAEFEKYARRRSLFGGRTLDVEPDDET